MTSPPTTLPPTTTLPPATSPATPTTTSPVPSEWWVSPHSWGVLVGIAAVVAVIGSLVVPSVRAKVRWLWDAMVDRLYPIRWALVVGGLGGLAQVIATAAGWAEAVRTRLLLLGGTFLAMTLALVAQLRYAAKSQLPTSHRRPWSISPPVNTFTGRREELSILRRQLRRPGDGTGLPPAAWTPWLCGQG
jgi:hypothetical protein